MSLRKAVDEKCRSCIVDSAAPGTWRQQVTLCSVYSCPLWEVRPTTKAEIPESILSYYGADPGEFQSKPHHSRQSESYASDGSKKGAFQDSDSEISREAG